MNDFDKMLNEIMEDLDKIFNTDQVLQDPMSLLENKKIRAVIPLKNNDNIMAMLIVTNHGYNEDMILSENCLTALTLFIKERINQSEHEQE